MPGQEDTAILPARAVAHPARCGLVPPAAWCCDARVRAQRIDSTEAIFAVSLCRCVVA